MQQTIHSSFLGVLIKLSYTRYKPFILKLVVFLFYYDSTFSELKWIKEKEH